VKCNNSRKLWRRPGTSTALLYLSTDAESPIVINPRVALKKNLTTFIGVSFSNQTISNLSTAELHVSELIGTAGHLDTQKILLI